MTDPIQTSNPASELALVQTGTAHDALAHCLAQLTEHFDRATSAQALSAGLPVSEDGMSPILFIRSAERVGLSARLLKRPIERISKLDLPMVLLLQDREACVLWQLNDQQCSISTSAGLRRELPMVELAAQYAGQGMSVSATPRFAAGTTTEEAMAKHHWFWATLTRSWPLYGEVALASVLTNVFAVLSPMFAMNVYDRVVPNNAIETFWVLAAGVFLLYVFDLLLKMLRGYFIDVAGKRADMALSATLFEQVMAMRLDAGRQSVGTLANNLREFESLREFFTSATLTTLIDLPFVLLFVVAVYLLGGWPMALVPLLAIPLVMAVGFALQIPMRNSVRRVYQATEAKHATLIESLGALETVKAVGAASRLQRKWEGLVDFVAAESLSTRLYSSLAVNFSAWVQAVTSIATLAVGVYQASANQLTTGTIIACSIISGRALAPLGTVASLMTRYHQSSSALEALNKIMDAPRERGQGQAFVRRQDWLGDIRFQDVTFKYPGQEVDALNGFSLGIRAGDRVGIIGRIGSGKSTLSKLLLALYQPQAGSILIDGTDIRSIDPSDLRRSIGYVPQNLVLFAGTVRDNLLIGTDGVDDAALLRAAALSGLMDIVNKHPKGFDMQVGERGEALSGGQRQTVALARALIGNPPILVLDEPTSSMDHSSEERFKQMLSTELNDKTVIIVTHRESLLTVVNTLVVVDGGRVLAAGPKDAVLKALAEGKVRAAQ